MENEAYSGVSRENQTVLNLSMAGEAKRSLGEGRMDLQLM